jgi:CIC family chloride channel protein
MFGDVVGHNPSLFLVIGVAAFLGAGYRVPIAAITFVAEATGKAGFIVPALIAAVVAEVSVGGQSVTTHQLVARPGTARGASD